jgi:hypothetical protein
MIMRLAILLLLITACDANAVHDMRPDARATAGDASPDGGETADAGTPGDVEARPCSRWPGYVYYYNSAGDISSRRSIWGAVLDNHAQVPMACYPAVRHPWVGQVLCDEQTSTPCAVIDGSMPACVSTTVMYDLGGTLFALCGYVLERPVGADTWETLLDGRADYVLVF